MKKYIFKEFSNRKIERPVSSSSLHNLPNLTNRFQKNKKLKEDTFEFKVNLNPKEDKENLSKYNMDLKQEIKDLNKKIDFLKSNNHKLSQIITQKNKQIDELTNQIILKNKELVTKEKKQKNKKNNFSEKSGKPVNTKSEESKGENKLEKELELKKCNHEISRVKEEYNKLIVEIRNKDQEILNLKRNKKITDYMEIKIKNDILTKEFNKLKEMYLMSLDMNKKNENFGENENILKAEIQTQHNIIIKLSQEIDEFSLERKKLNTEINELKSKLELSLNNNKLLKKAKDNYEKKYKKNIKDQVLEKEYEEKKHEMKAKINKLEKDLKSYKMNANKEKNFGAIPKNSNIIINKNINNNINNNFFGEMKKNVITARHVPNPEENLDNKILLMQSIITELMNEKKELLEKLKYYENNKNEEQLESESLQEKNICKIKLNEELIIGDNKENEEENKKDLLINNNIINKNNEELENNKEEELENDKIDDYKTEENIKNEGLNFDDIFNLNLEYKNINSSTAENIFKNIFSLFKEPEQNKNSLLESLVNKISIRLNCDTNGQEKKLIYNKIKTYIDKEGDLHKNFYMLFNNIINHTEEEIKKIDEENESLLHTIFQENKNVIKKIIENQNSKMNINNFYNILLENKIILEKNIFMFLCYKLKTDNCNSLYDIEILGLSKYIE